MRLAGGDAGFGSMAEQLIRLTRGFHINLEGSAESHDLDVVEAPLFALKPTDLHGIGPIPKLSVQEGDEVRAGEPLFFDKSNPGIWFCSPVSGEIVEIRRGERRAITHVVVLADSTQDFHEHPKLDPHGADRAALVETMLRGGVWPLIRQRPYNVLANPALTPRDIFVSCFDSAPLAGDAGRLIEGREEAFQLGLYALGRLTTGQVHLGVSTRSPEVYRNAEGVRVHTFAGPHPAGNVGIQIHHAAPISRGDIVWTVKPQDVAIMGALCRDGIFDARRVVAVTGAELERTGYVDTCLGAAVDPWVADNLKQPHVRLISGNVLTGTRVERDGFLGLFDEQLTVIAEGDEPEFLGWLVPSYGRPSMSRTLPAFLTPGKRYRANSNNHGEQRAFVMTGEYEKVVPMDIYPQHLIKAILCDDYDRMEGLGIYEVVEEDLALCEFVCTSKQPVQRLLRKGLDTLRLES